jgi:hypothetical protein
MWGGKEGLYNLQPFEGALSVIVINYILKDTCDSSMGFSGKDGP